MGSKLVGKIEVHGSRKKRGVSDKKYQNSSGVLRAGLRLL